MQFVWRRIVPLLPVLFAISAWHAWDAHRQGEPVWPTVVATVVLVGLLGVLAQLVARPIEGLSDKEARARRAESLRGLHRWAALLAVAGVAVRLVAYFSGYR